MASPKKESAAVRKALIKDLKSALKGKKGYDVLDYVDAPPLCCDSGTVAIVRIEIQKP